MLRFVIVVLATELFRLSSGQRIAQEKAKPRRWVPLLGPEPCLAAGATRAGLARARGRLMVPRGASKYI